MIPRGMKHTALGELINFCNGRVQMMIPLSGAEMLMLGELALVLAPAESTFVPFVSMISLATLDSESWLVGSR